MRLTINGRLIPRRGNKGFFAHGALPAGAPGDLYLRRGAFESVPLGQVSEEKPDAITAFARRWGDVIKLGATVLLVIRFFGKK